MQNGLTVQAGRSVDACAPAGRPPVMTRSLLHILNCPVRRFPLNRNTTAGRCARWLGLSLAPVVLACRSHATQGDAPAASPEGPTSSQQSASSLSAPQQLRLAFGSVLLPHPEKVARGGEDGFFISEDGRSFGVADGVGSWILSGIDAGEYAKSLMRHACEAAKRLEPSSSSPTEMLEYAHSRTQLQGSSTALVLTLEGSTLHAANVGDSGFMVVREGQAIFRSPSQQKRFNFPFQLACGDMGDPPSCAERFSVGLKIDDIIVSGTDGLWDNVFPEAATAIAAQLRWRGRGPQDVADALAEYARQRAMSNDDSPFSVGARQAGMWGMSGGKLDDITVVVACVGAASNL